MLDYALDFVIMYDIFFFLSYILEDAIGVVISMLLASGESYNYTRTYIIYYTNMHTYAVERD